MTDNKRDTSNTGKSSEDPTVGALGGLGGLTDGIASLIGKLGELAEKGEQLRKSGEFQSRSGKDVKGSYGFSMRFGAGSANSGEPTVQSFQKSKATGSTSKPKIEDREPQVDVFEEGNSLLVIAEMPGIAKEDIVIEFEGKRLTLSGCSSRVRFSKQVELPQEVAQENVELGINNGVVEIRLKLIDA